MIEANTETVVGGGVALTMFTIWFKGWLSKQDLSISSNESQKDHIERLQSEAKKWEERYENEAKKHDETTELLQQMRAQNVMLRMLLEKHGIEKSAIDSALEAVLGGSHVA